jgi:septation ring formation regulator EzrA
MANVNERVDNNNFIFAEEEVNMRNLFSALSDLSQEVKLLKAKINELNNYSVEVRETVNEIKKDVENINDLQEKTQESCKNMDAHIDFVEKTYDYFTKATPLSYMSSFKEKLWPRKSLENKKEQ